MLNDWPTDVEAKQGRTLSDNGIRLNEKNMPKKFVFCMIYCVDDARPAYTAISSARPGLQRCHEAGEEELVT